MKKCKASQKECIVLFSLLTLLMIPCISFATTMDNIQPELSLNSSFYVASLDSGSVQHGGSGVNDFIGQWWWGKRKPPCSPTPIPAAAWLLGTGLIGLFGIRRKLKK